MFSLYQLRCKTCDPQAGSFLAPGQGHNLNKLGGGPLADVTYQTPRLYTLWFQKKIYFMFSLYKPM